MTRHKNAPRLWADLSLLAVCIVWGATFVMVKEALGRAGPLTFLALRFSLAAVILIPPLLARRGQVSVGLGGSGVAIGMLLFAGYGFQTVGLQYTSASKAGFITGLSVVIVPVVSAWLQRQPPSPWIVLGVTVATAGLGLLSLQEQMSAELGDLLVLGCALAFALHILVVGRFASRYDVLALTALQIVAAAALTGALAVLLEAPRGDELLAVLPAALFTGLFATVAAFYLQTRAQRLTSPTHTALIFATEPVFAALFGYLLAGERLGIRELIGCALILGGMLVAQLAPEREIARA